MNLTKLDIDFSKANHVITLIVGNNGTGKTAMMSNFHPFATLGNLENREDSDLIIPKKDGLKEIWYTNKDDEYYIKHIYQYVGEKRSRKISSYIEKNGKELNPTGTVTQFINIIESEFQIDVNFLKLLRLGPNVQNFVQLSATERKGFISKLLEEVDIYMKDYKYAVERSKLLKNALKLAINKQDKLHISDVSLLEASIVQKERLLEENRQEKEKRIKQFYEFKGSLDVDTLSNYDDLMDNIEHELKRIQKDISNIPSPIYDHYAEGDGTPSAKYNELLRKLHDDRADIVSQRAKILAKLDHELETVKALESQLDETEKNKELQEMELYIDELKAQKTEYYEKYRGEIPPYNKAEWNDYVGRLELLRSIILDILELPVNGLRFLKSYYIEHGITIDSIAKYQKKLQREANSLMEQRALLNITKAKPNKSYVYYVPSECQIYRACPYYLSHTNGDSAKEGKSKIDSFDIEIENRNVAIDILRRIFEASKIFHTMDTFSIRYDKGLDGFILAILNQAHGEFIDYKALMSTTEWIEDYQSHKEVLEKLEKYENQMYIYSKSSNIESRDSILHKLSSVTLTVAEYRAAVTDMDKKLDFIKSSIRLTEERISDLEVFNNQQLLMEKYNNELKEVMLEKQRLLNMKELKDEYEYLSKEYRRDMVDLESRIEKLDDEIFKAKRDIIEYQQLSDEINHIKERFDIVEILKEAVSTSKGIPLIYINSYFKSLQSLANEIIKTIYSSDFSLGEFVVNDKEFRIPYITKGAEVRDIKYASQAESSVATLAISFAMLEQFSSNYNIILLDEVDGPMYKQNKEKFFAALEGMLEKLNSEQVFIITQSTMFNAYPVNLIITDPNYKLDGTDNIIFRR